MWIKIWEARESNKHFDLLSNKVALLSRIINWYICDVSFLWVCVESVTSFWNVFICRYDSYEEYQHERLKREEYRRDYEKREYERAEQRETQRQKALVSDPAQCFIQLLVLFFILLNLKLCFTVKCILLRVYPPLEVVSGQIIVYKYLRRKVPLAEETRYYGKVFQSLSLSLLLAGIIQFVFSGFISLSSMRMPKESWKRTHIPARSLSLYYWTRAKTQLWIIQFPLYPPVVYFYHLCGVSERCRILLITPRAKCFWPDNRGKS